MGNRGGLKETAVKAVPREQLGALLESEWLNDYPCFLSLSRAIAPFGRDWRSRKKKLGNRFAMSWWTLSVVLLEVRGGGCEDLMASYNTMLRHPGSP